MTQDSLHRHTDKLFACLMVCQWIAGIVIAILFSPRTWNGTQSYIHLHVYAAIFLGGVITALPVFFALVQPGRVLTRHVIAIGQMLMSALLIHLTGGRIETHFHVFGSLAILAFYRDWKVLISASTVVVLDHLLRGLFWPQSVYGTATAPIWRTLEHGWWVIFEVAFLLVSIKKSLGETMNIAERQADLEQVNERIERIVTERTSELTREISERKQAEENLKLSEAQLRQSQKMEAVGRLAGGVAHDFNNLLTVINGYCAMTVNKLAKDSPLRRNAEEIQKAADRAASLTGQLLAFSRKQVLQPKVINLKEVIGGMGKMLRRLIGENIELTTLHDDNVGNIKADPGQIEQVVLNMAINARDAMPNGGKLTVRTSNVTIDQASHFRNRKLDIGEYIMLSISDTGVGITEEVKTHLFEPFFTTKGVGRGTGLGLATCYGIICQSDGDIRVYSEIGSGTTFKIYLPRVDAPAASTIKNPEADLLPEGNETILIVEDDSSVRKLSASVLLECGYQVIEARDGVEAFELLQCQPAPGLVLTDVIMPKMSGRVLHDRIKVIMPEMKILFMSGYTDDALAHHNVLDQNFSFLEKPFSPARLARKVREVLDQSPNKIARIPSAEIVLT
ncbi:MAG TPA: ATP-binding protein [Verrucomicrobiae bacterium]|nr:ATP-binding protein [Verrucomicrobiae bacterium]